MHSEKYGSLQVQSASWVKRLRCKILLLTQSGHRPPLNPFRGTGVSWYDPPYCDGGWLHETARVHHINRWCGGLAGGRACRAAARENSASRFIQYCEDLLTATERPTRY